MLHQLNSNLLSRKVNVTLIGAGGTGSQVLSGLARLHLAMVARGHPGGLNVTVWDDDRVSQANVGRQLFSMADVGLPKARVLIHRLNLFYGLGWKNRDERFIEKSSIDTDIVVGCVDSRSARRAIHAALCRNSGYNRPKYWLDFGNRAADGQVVLGEPLPDHCRDWFMRLPTVMELYPDMLDKEVQEDHDTPSCSLAEALDKQELFINQAMATHGLQMLWKLFSTGAINHNAVFVNLNLGRVSSLPIDRESWKRFGHKGARKPPTKKSI